MRNEILKDITTKIGSGATPSGGQNAYHRQGVSLIRSQNVHDFVFSNDGLAFISDEQAESLNNVTVKENDVLLNITGDSIARCCIVPREILPARVNQHVSIIRCNESVNSNYMLYYLQYLKPYLLKICGVGGTRNALTKKVIEELEIRIPKNQDKIANILHTLDKKIELNNRINSELEAMMKALYDYWFLQFDFPNDQGKPYKASGGKMEYKKELNREIPKEWTVASFNDVADIIGGSTPSTRSTDNFTRTGIPWITPKDLALNIGNKFVTKGETDVTEKGFKSASLKLMPSGTILLSSRAPIGYMAISRGKVTTNQGFKSFIPKLGYPSSFLFFLVKSHIPTFLKNASGSTFMEISGKTLKEISIYLPQRSIIEKFSEKVDLIFEKQNNLELENQELTKLRDFLLPLLMNGQVIVK